MKRPCLFVRRWRWFALLLIPFAAWGVVLAIVPTGWAKARLVAKLAGATGRSVRIGALRLGVLGELRILDLTIAEPGSPAHPWLRVDEARIDVHLGQILTGRCQPRKVEVRGVSARVWRRKDGSTEIADLLADRSGTVVGRAPNETPEAPDSMALQVSGSRIAVVDDLGGTRLEVSDVTARASWGGRLVTIEELRGRVNGGTLAMAARLDRDPASPRFQAELRAVAIELDGGLPVLGQLVPIVAGSTERVGGKFDLRLILQGRGTTRAEVRRSLSGVGSLVLDPIDLGGSKILDELEVLGAWPHEGKIGSVTTEFRVDRERITTDDLTIRTSRFPFVLGGWADFDGRFDYGARVDQIIAKLPKEAKGLVSELRVSLDQLAGLRMRGSPDHIEVTLQGHPLTGNPDRPDDERARFRENARRIRDRFFR